jgi:hypothetical protein
MSKNKKENKNFKNLKLNLLAIGNKISMTYYFHYVFARHKCHFRVCDSNTTIGLIR